ncbi:hypothetical protein [Congregibacter litoralis]|uniref:Uncharacterized protein n=1 Tax=Congregibacter litoralis KT71 TaxID=314285 RepID=A4ABI8_9GAMM|nr:hypothetical protein [Congregibacter litoralis]EAQ96742.1 hypothetical protein KT71_06954 [Congregibacter litoralis KT71]
MSKLLQPILVLCLFFAPLAHAEEPLRPYVLVDSVEGSLDEQLEGMRDTLEKSDFEIVGEYRPYSGTAVLAITHPALLEAASTREFGAYAAVLRMGLSQVGEEVQRSYANPTYWGQAFQVGPLDAVSAALNDLLGEGKPFGSKKGLSAKKLASYRYMMMMPKFKDHDQLGSFSSHAKALSTVRGNLGNNVDKLTEVFEVAVPGTEEVLFGVAIGSGDGNDRDVMATTDTGELKHSAHLPYALLVSGNNVYALAGKFRIALAFPDLGMGTFMKISGAPGAIRESLGSLTHTPGPQ